MSLKISRFEYSILVLPTFANAISWLYMCLNGRDIFPALRDRRSITAPKFRPIRGQRKILLLKRGVPGAGALNLELYSFVGYIMVNILIIDAYPFTYSATLLLKIFIVALSPN